MLRQIPTSLVETGYRYDKRGKYVILWSLKSTVTPQTMAGARKGTIGIVTRLRFGRPRQRGSIAAGADISYFP